jgi:hypothetical protein
MIVSTGQTPQFLVEFIDAKICRLPVIDGNPSRVPVWVHPFRLHVKSRI